MEQAAEHIAGAGFLESFVQRYPMAILETLLRDRSAGRNIIWADNEYEALGEGYMGDDEITVDKICGLSSGVIKPRIAKAAERQSQRTKSRAEVFTPSWLCNQMNNDIDEQWFGRRDVFNVETVDGEGCKSWTATTDPVEFPKTKGRGWQSYANATRLEITCGEAPFVCSRYDTVTGEPLPVQRRIGFLDRKLRVVSENAKTRATWTKWALAALKATYGYEYQGDNLLIARINVFETFMEHLKDRWDAPATAEELEQAALIVSWNFWQMNGFTDAVPTNKMGAVAESPLGEQSALFEEPKSEPIQASLFDLLDEPESEIIEEEPPQATVPLCVLYDWKNGEPFEFAALKGKANPMGKKFYAVIGNPPYQTEGNGNKTFAPPIYHEFMDASFEVAEKVELVTPARFLFNAGSTPKPWNQKMLNDEHFKVMHYEADASKMFPGTDIKGGVSVTYRDANEDFGAITVFTPFEELNSILGKVCGRGDFISMATVAITRTAYKLTEKLHSEHPEALEMLSKGHAYDVSTNIFDRLSHIFFDEIPNDSNEYIKLYGRAGNSRVHKYVKRDYINTVPSLGKFKIVYAKADGAAGTLGKPIPARVLGNPIVEEPGVGTTESFLTVGLFDTQAEAGNALRYVKTKFFRALVGVLKTTQDINPEKFSYVPLQDFTANSDIDWSKPIPEIDQQLYAKYGLDETEIEFIETHVKEMS